MRLKLMYYFRPSPRKTFSLIKNTSYLAKSFEKTINIDPIHYRNPIFSPKIINQLITLSFVSMRAAPKSQGILNEQQILLSLGHKSFSHKIFNQFQNNVGHHGVI